jgi:phosphoribosyl 1,2-cyclic phosphodiesterase
VGYYIEVGDYRFTIMTDVGDVTENVRNYIQKSTHLILEANYDEEMLQQGRYPEILKERIVSGHGHLSNKKSAIALAENFHEHLKHVWLCHLSEENNHPELARKTVETTLRSYGIIAGVDFSLEVLRRKIPTGPFQLGEMANCQFSLPFEG